MNKRQRKKQIKIRNKKLIKQYPFLIPRSCWTGKVVKGFDYTWTEYDCLSKGWKIGFGKLLLDELKEACLKTDYLNKLFIMEWKEKYGQNRIYINAAPQEVHDVIQKYEFISEYVCYNCGSPDAIVVDDYGWYLPKCKCCWDKNNRKREEKGYKTKPWEEVADLEHVGLPNEYRYITYSKGEDETTTVDISETTKKIRKK